jgi:hypothetical protein
LHYAPFLLPQLKTQDKLAFKQGANQIKPLRRPHLFRFAKRWRRRNPLAAFCF